MRISDTGLVQEPMEGERKSINSELWHACAGPKVSLPPVNSLVVYFPQGHSEQVAASTQKEVDGHIPNYPNVPSQLICQLHNITLHADVETDEVFAQMTLQPVNGLNMQEKDMFFPPDLGSQNRQPTDFFCKILTASDTSTHGGFSVPRRAAEKVFPPLDFSKQPPAQELHVKDLHDQTWTFRHIYRGQPKRHLLTTGWSVFVSAKRLFAGDSVLFIRDDKGKLLLGIRRANRQQSAMPSSVLSSDSMHIGVLAAAAHAAATSSRFIVFYNPRTSPSEFVIPLSKYNKAIYGTQVSVGMRFRMVFETEESTLRRYMGTISAISDLDAVRWPNSQWRNLEVGWDESSAGERPRRVSIWEIEPICTPFLICSPSFSLRHKRPQLPGLLGEDIDADINMKRCLTWLRGESSNSSLAYQELGPDTWMRLQQRIGASPPVASTDIYNAMAATALQDLRTSDASKQLQQPQQMQFRLPQSLLQQQVQQLENQQQHLLWQRSLSYPQLFQSSQPHQQTSSSTQSQQQLQPLLSQPQLQTPSLMQQHVQAPSLLQQQLQAPILSQQPLQPPLLQQQVPSLPSQRQVNQLPDISANLLPLSSSRSQPTFNISSSVRPQPSFSGGEAPFISSATVLPAQGILGSSSIEESCRSSTVLRPNSTNKQQQQSKQGPLLTAASSLPQMTGAWFSSARSPVQAESSMLNNVQLDQTEALSASSSSCPFPLLSESLAQIAVASMPLQSSSVAFQEPCQQHEPQPDVWSQHLFGASVDSFSSRGINIDRDVQARGVGVTSSTIPVSFPSPNGSFSLSPASFALPSTGDLSMNTGLMVSGGLDEVLLSHGCNWPQIAAPVRTFTKVQKSGCIGRSLDVSRFKNYKELRQELARMFNLEGKLEDPHKSGWQLVFIDNDGDVLLVGDDPWEEFVNCVRIIKILSPSEVQMNRDGFDLLAIPMQQTSSSSEDYHPWKDSRAPSGDH